MAIEYYYHSWLIEVLRTCLYSEQRSQLVQLLGESKGTSSSVALYWVIDLFVGLLGRENIEGKMHWHDREAFFQCCNNILLQQQTIASPLVLLPSSRPLAVSDCLFSGKNEDQDRYNTRE